MLLAVPVGFFGGALAGGLIGEGYSVATVILGCCGSNSYLLNPLSIGYGLIEYGIFGALIGVLLFPIAYAAVARTRNVFATVPAALLASVLGGWTGIAIDEALAWTWLSLVLILGVPLASMFCACAWAAARERRKIAGRP